MNHMTLPRWGAKMQSVTCLVKREGSQYVSLCVELDVASFGKTKEKAMEGLTNAIETYIEYMSSQKREDEIYRPVPMDELRDFLFPGPTSNEQAVKAIPFKLEYA